MVNDQNNLNQFPQNGNTGTTPVQPITPSAPLEQGGQQNVVNPVQQAPVQPQQVQNEVVTAAPVEQIQQVQPGMQQPMQTMQQPMQQQPIQQQPMQQQPMQQQPMQQQPMQQPVNQNIVQQEAINPIANNPQPVINNGVIGPSAPLEGGFNMNGVNDVTNVGFVPVDTPPPKKKNTPLIAGISLVLVIGLGLLGYFVIYPFVMRTFFADPKKVYETTINQAFKSIQGTSSEFIKNKNIVNLEASFDTDIPDFKQFAGYTYGINFGMDADKKLAQFGLVAKNEQLKKETSYFTYIKNNKQYLKFSTYLDYILAGDVDKNMSEMFEQYKEIIKNSTVDSDYLVIKINQLLNESIDEEKLFKEDSVIEINGEEYKVTNNRYEINNKTLEAMQKHILEGLKNDEKAIELIGKSNDMTTSEVKDMLKDVKLINIDEKVYNFSIYTYGNKAEVLGIGLIDNDNDVNIHFYKKDKAFDLYFESNYTDEETGKDITNKITAIGTPKGDNTEVEIKFNGEKLATLDVRPAINENSLDFDFRIENPELPISGTVKLTNESNDERAKVSFSIRVNMNKQYVAFNLNFSNDWKNEVANINTDGAVQMSPEDIAKKQQEFVTALMQTPLGIFFSTISGDFAPSIPDYQNPNNNITPPTPNVPSNPIVPGTPVVPGV